MQKNPAPASYYSNNWRVNKAAAGGGLFYDLAPHQLDLVIYFFGEAINYSGMATNKAGLYEVEDTVTGKMQLQNGIEFTGDWCFAAETEIEKDEFIIQGEKGSIQFAVFGQQIIIEKEGQKDVIHFEPPVHIQQPMIERIVNYFLDKAPNPCSAADAIQSMRVMEAFVYGYNL
jgi:predicted dehydrogenase